MVFLPCLAIETVIIFAHDDAGRRGHPRHHYWAAILPETVSGGSSQAGAASSVYAAFLGAPRVIHASMTAAF